MNDFVVAFVLLGYIARADVLQCALRERIIFKNKLESFRELARKLFLRSLRMCFIRFAVSSILHGSRGSRMYIVAR